MKYNGQELRPIWQIVLLLPLWPLYLVARPFVKWMDSI